MDNILTFKVDVDGWDQEQIDDLVARVTACGKQPSATYGHPPVYIEVSLPRSRCEECGSFNDDDDANDGEATDCGVCEKCTRPLCLHASAGGTWLVDDTCTLEVTSG